MIAMNIYLAHSMLWRTIECNAHCTIACAMHDHDHEGAAAHKGLSSLNVTVGAGVSEHFHGPTLIWLVTLCSVGAQKQGWYHPTAKCLS